MGLNDRKTLVRLGMAVAVVGVVVLLVIANNGGDAGPSEVQHIHGMAVDPQEPANLYLATHHGLFYGNQDTGWSRVGEVQDDLMGFTIDVDGQRLWSSGHPVTGGNMGCGPAEKVAPLGNTLAFQEWISMR